MCDYKYLVLFRSDLVPVDLGDRGTNAPIRFCWDKDQNLFHKNAFTIYLSPSDFQRFHRLCDALEDKVCLRIARFSYLNVSLSVPKDTFSAINFNQLTRHFNSFHTKILRNSSQPCEM